MDCSRQPDQQTPGCKSRAGATGAAPALAYRPKRKESKPQGSGDLGTLRPNVKRPPPGFLSGTPAGATSTERGTSIMPYVTARRGTAGQTPSTWVCDGCGRPNPRTVDACQGCGGSQ